MDVQRGFRDKLGKYVNLNEAVDIEMRLSGKSVYDYCCFGVDNNNKLSDDRYMIFFNQTSSPNGEIAFSEVNGGAVFKVNLSRLPNNIEKLVFTVSIDGNGRMGEISSHELTIKQNGNSAISLRLSGNDFQNERAIISIEIYRKDEWRIAAVARGFDGGLSELLKSYGGEEIAPSETSSVSPVSNPVNTVQSNPQPQKVSLEKKLQQSAPQLVSLAKPIKVELEKQKLTDVVARVALVMDISGSMTGRYSNGTVQEIVNKALPHAVQFDDDGELDFWYFGSRCRRMPSVNMSNYQSAVPRDWKKLMSALGGGTNAPDVMNSVYDEYCNSKIPAYVIFVTDGCLDSEWQVKKIMVKASEKPIFWQFVGVGGSGYGMLKKLDTMKGRYVDNANFFALDDFRKVSNEDLYHRLLNEFPQWLKEIKDKGMI